MTFFKFTCSLNPFGLFCSGLSSPSRFFQRPRLLGPWEHSLLPAKTPAGHFYSSCPTRLFNCPSPLLPQVVVRCTKVTITTSMKESRNWEVWVHRKFRYSQGDKETGGRENEKQRHKDRAAERQRDREEEGDRQTHSYPSRNFSHRVAYLFFRFPIL